MGMVIHALIYNIKLRHKHRAFNSIWYVTENI